jgi:hypothetical protein
MFRNCYNKYILDYDNGRISRNKCYIGDKCELSLSLKLRDLPKNTYANAEFLFLAKKNQTRAKPIKKVRDENQLTGKKLR